MEENKFNFSEDPSNEESKEKVVQESKDAIKKDAVGLLSSFLKFINNLLDFRDDTDRDATIEAIKADIPFKGATAWILICSIFVASIGLNANSTAVVIGAMLISPLMGPILGLGLSLAINDIDTLKKSLINLGTMLFLSLLTAFLFFKFFPLSEETSELFARTRPDIRDVLIAFFGGASLMIARTKKGTIASVIFGVAIATALMPPLCTAGFGLAKGNWNFFFGAMYLFTINTIFIALAAFVVLKVLRFPMLKYANSKKRKRIAQLASLVAIIVMIPAIKTFMDVWEETKYEMDYKNYMSNEVNSNDDLWLQRDDLDMDNKTIKLFFNGNVSKEMRTSLSNDLKDYENIQNFKLIINSNNSRSTDLIADMYDRATIDLEQKGYIIEGLEIQIDSLKKEITDLKTVKTKAIDVTSLAKDAKIKFEALKSFGYSTMLESKDFMTIDTIGLVKVSWKKSLSDSLKTVEESNLKTWLITNTKQEIIEIKRD
jgi:uncharacterized hydrophobic protein (TIGR00271 family)